MRIRSQCVAGFDHRTSAVQRVRYVLADELRNGILSDGVGHLVRLVVLDVSQEGRAVFHALQIRLQDRQVRSYRV